ncbi:MAG: hypothetical protein DRJ67_09320 [Thermoprotei archaeon]|nr:MAG: hypothetical protein DRJ67_09320 [Thermoprotei archaeon]
MGDKVKTSIMVDRELWEEFKSRVGSERGLRALSRAVEEAIEDEVSGLLIIRALERLLGGGRVPLAVMPVGPRVPTDAGKAVRELRGSRLRRSRTWTRALL